MGTVMDRRFRAGTAVTVIGCICTSLWVVIGIALFVWSR